VKCSATSDRGSPWRSRREQVDCRACCLRTQQVMRATVAEKPSSVFRRTCDWRGIHSTPYGTRWLVLRKQDAKIDKGTLMTDTCEGDDQSRRAFSRRPCV